METNNPEIQKYKRQIKGQTAALIICIVIGLGVFALGFYYFYISYIHMFILLLVDTEESVMWMLKLSGSAVLFTAGLIIFIIGTIVPSVKIRNRKRRIKELTKY